MDWLAKMAKKLFAYNIILIAAFFVLPIIAAFEQDANIVKTIILFSLLKVNPEISFFTAAVFGAKNGFKWKFALVVGGWFLIAIFLFFFNIVFLLYLLMYMVSALVGCWFGSLFKSHIDEMYL